MSRARRPRTDPGLEPPPNGSRVNVALDWPAYLLLAAVGVFVGALNVVAGGGSFLTLPVLIFLGLPPTMANGTNRVGILLQNLGAVWSFHRHRVLDWGWGWSMGLPAVAGAALGTWAALVIGDEAFKRILAMLMVTVTVWTLIRPASSAPRAGRPAQASLVGLGFLVIGAYGGFVQAGVGFFILAGTSWAGLDLVRGNAVKVLSVLLFTVLSLGIFAWQDQVHWACGLALGAGTALGGLIGVRLTIGKGERWVSAVVTVAVVVFAIKLWLS
jgi:uncharacterized membrane protein YfcA